MRRSRRVSNSNNLGKIGIIFIGFIVLFSLIKIIGLNHKQKDLRDDDFKLGIITDSELQLISFSENRKMVNILKVKGDALVWLPNGQGWQKVSEMKKIVSDNKNINLANDVLWYNFGFLVNKTSVENDSESWKNDWWLISKMGFSRWFKYKTNSSQMLFKEEQIDKSLKDDTELLDEIMPRDFAENKLISEDLKLSVFNATSETGLASFMASRLEWMGYLVISADNTSQKVDKCLLVYGPKTETKLGWLKLVNIFKNCKTEFDDNLNDDEVELYFGEGFVSMVKYSSYK